MSAHHEERGPTSVGEFLLALIGGLGTPLIAIIMIAGLIYKVQTNQIDTDKVDNSVAVTAEAIKPVGQLVAVDANAPRVEQSGEQVYNAVCTSCHAAGALGAPKVGDKGQWGPRLAKGYDGLLKSAIGGIRQMPARGGNPDLSDTEVGRAIVFMANQSGASFKMP